MGEVSVDVALAQRLKRGMLEFAVAVSEGFCPRCQTRLVKDEFGALCPTLDHYPVVVYRDGNVYSTTFTVGWFRRGEPHPAHDQ